MIGKKYIKMHIFLQYLTYSYITALAIITREPTPIIRIVSGLVPDGNPQFTVILQTPPAVR